MSQDKFVPLSLMKKIYMCIFIYVCGRILLYPSVTRTLYHYDSVYKLLPSNYNIFLIKHFSKRKIIDCHFHGTID